MENILRAVLKMKVVSDNTYWTLHSLSYIKEFHSILLESEIARLCLERIYHLPINTEHLNVITPLLRIIGNLVTEETGQTGLYLLHELNMILFIGEKLLISGYKHLCNEFIWVIGNIVIHPAPMVQQIVKSKECELKLLEQMFCSQ